MIKTIKIFYTSFLFFIYSFFYSQNLVPNSSFETYTACPWNTAQLPYTSNWLNCGASTDYFNSCAGGGFVSVPANLQGYQPGADGNGYIGLIAFALHDNGTGPTYYREPAGTFLTQTLTIGTKYFASFKVALTLNNFESCCASNKLGIRFSTIPYSTSNPAPVNNFAHIYSNSIITDSLNWSTISGSFVADSSYKFISIGNFYDTLNTAVIDYYNNYPNTYASYYYVDDVRISTDSNFVLAGINTYDNIESVVVYPNPTSEKIFIKGLKNSEIEIYDTLGQRVLQKNYIIGEEINISNLNSGVYLFVIKSFNQQFKPIKIQKI